MWGGKASLVSHPHKYSDISYTLAGWHAVEGTCPGWIRLNSCAFDDVGTESDLLWDKLTLGTIQGDTRLMASLQGRNEDVDCALLDWL